MVNLLLPLTMRHFRLVVTALLGMDACYRIVRNHDFIQNGSTSLYNHCRNVALMSLKIARSFKIKVDEDSLVRGALLHDYYLYDWHDKLARPHLHGFFHPGIALKNALEEFDLNSTEKDIIKHHMFPLTLVPPSTKEGWIVSVADKLCSLYETFRRNEVHLRKRNVLV